MLYICYHVILHIVLNVRVDIVFHHVFFDIAFLPSHFWGVFGHVKVDTGLGLGLGGPRALQSETLICQRARF